MSNKFVQGNTYVFVTKKVMKGCKEKKDKMDTMEWARLLNGRIVKPINEYNGRIGGFGVNVSWCKCIKVGEKVR